MKKHYAQLDEQGKKGEDIFFASADENKHLHISAKNEPGKGVSIPLGR